MEIERLIDRHKDAVYRQMVRVCGNHDDAEDALSDALVAALKASEQLRDPTNFQAWLARIGSRACSRMRIRERLVQFWSISDLEAKGFEIVDPHGDPSQEAEQTYLKSCVAGAIEQLPELFRDVYVRREILGEPAEKVAKDLGITIAACKTRLHRARNIVRDALDSGIGCELVPEEV